MRRALLGCLLGALIAAGTFAVIAKSGAFPDGAEGPRIAIVVDDNSAVSLDRVQAALPSFQDYLSRLCVAWHCSGSLYVTDKAPPAGSSDWIINVVDYSPCMACYGFHDRIGNVPIAFVTTEDLTKKVTWTEILTHELAEMLIDPNVSLWSGREDNTQNPYSVYKPITMYALEVCDPVQGNRFQINGYIMADFVYRSWFTKGVKGPYDYMRKVANPFELGPVKGWAIVYENGRESTIGATREASLWEAH